MSAPDVREAAERVRKEREYREQTSMCDNYTDHARSRQREQDAIEDLLRAALAAPVSPDEATLTEYLSRCRPGTTREEAARDLGMLSSRLAPVSPPAVAKRERRTVWFMENNAGLWMGSDMGSHTRDPNAAAQFTTREACEAACERDRASGPHPGVRVYRPTEHIFFGDDEVSVSPPAASRDAVAEVLLHEAHPDLAPWSLLQLSGHNSAGLVCAVALARRQADAILSRWSAPPAPRGEAVAYLVVDGCGGTWDVFTARSEADLCVSACNATGTHGGGRPGPFRVVALVPRESPSEEPAT